MNEKLKAVIIDDVPQAIQSLKADIAAYCPEIEVVGTADGVVSGAKLLKQSTVDIVFLDIHMQDGTGFDILEIVGDLSAKVIFTTGSNEFAIKAFRFAATDYLLKPVDPDELLEAVRKAKPTIDTPEQVDLLKQSLQTAQPLSRIALHTQDKIQVVNISDIIRCESTGNYTVFYFANNKKLLVTKTLKEYDKLFVDSGFLRVHQSHLINTQHIAEFVKIDGGYVVMNNQDKVPVSVRKKALVMSFLTDGIG